MLKYVIVICVISLCESTLIGQRKSYSSLILVEHYPISSFFVRHINYGLANVKSLEFAEYLRDHWDLFEEEKWIVHGLWFLTEEGTFIIPCPADVDETFDVESLDPILREKLRKAWPGLQLNKSVESIWERQYKRYGSCITTDPSTYFREAIRLLEEYNIGTILYNASLYTGNAYRLNIIIDTINNALRTSVYLKCLPALGNNLSQYLLEVQVCFDSSHKLTSCIHRRNLSSNNHFCDRQTSVIYPETPTFPLDS